jgi:L-malate glycosyltransferase
MRMALPGTSAGPLKPRLQAEGELREMPVRSASLPPIRVFYLLDSLDVGGTETQAVELARRLDAERFRVTLGCLRARGPLRQRLEPGRVKILEFHSRDGIDSPGGMYQLLRLAAFLRRGSFEVVHTHDLWSNLLGIPSARLAGVPVIISSCRDLSHGDWYTPRRRRILRRIQRSWSMVLANSSAIRDDLVARDGFTAEEVRVIRNAVDMDRFAVAGDRKRVVTEADDGKLIVLLGNMVSEVKGHAYLIEAARTVIAAFPQTRFVLIGDGPLRPEFVRQIRELGLSENFIFLGRRSDVPELLASCDLAVLPSLAEGLPNAVLEYLAAGLPTVATRVGGNVEIVEDGHTGLLVPPKDAGALAKAILRLLENPDLADALGQAGQNQVRENFSFARLLDETAGLYGELLERKARRTRHREPTAMNRPRVKLLEVGNYPPPMCGWAMQTKLVVDELRRRGHLCQVLKINENRQRKDPAYLDVQGGWDFFWKVLRHTLKGYRVNVHVNGHSKKGYLLALCGLMVAKLTFRPALVTFHGGLSQPYFPRHDVRSLRWAFAWLFRVADAIACDSIEVKKAIESYGIAGEKITPVATFSGQYVEYTPVALSAAVEDFLAQHGPVFFSYLAFRPEYRLDLLREGMRLFCRTYPRAGFLWLGFTSRELEQAEQFVAAWPSQEKQSVLLLGNLPHDEFLTLLSRSSACLRTPACDGVSASVLESLALGVPVVASDNGSRPAGVISYQESDPADMSSKLVQVTEHGAELKANLSPPSSRDNVALMADWLAAGKSTRVQKSCPPNSGGQFHYKEQTMEISRKMWALIVLASFLVGAGAAAGIGAVQIYRTQAAKAQTNSSKTQQNAK